MGLALGLATTFFFTAALKNLIGKPRPDLLSRCNLDPATVQQYALGGLGTQLPLWNLLISSTACRQPDTSKLDDGFNSFPSGHSSCKCIFCQDVSSLTLLYLVSWAGMFYLALFLCSKFSVTVPYLLPYNYETSARNNNGFQHGVVDDNFDNTKDDVVASANSTVVPLRNQAAAPPAHLYILPLICISVAAYVATTRFSDFRHHGIDIFSGSLMGAIISYISFRMYHLPIRRGAGWSWGPRSASRAWGIGVGTQGYTDGNGSFAKERDVEAVNDKRMPVAGNTNGP